MFYENVRKANELENAVAGRRAAKEPLDDLPNNTFELIRRRHAAEAQVRAPRRVRRHMLQQEAEGYKERVKEIEVRIGATVDDYSRNMNRARWLEEDRE